MIITAFDLATATGVCDGPVGSSPRVFSWYLDDAGKGRPERLAALFDFLERYFRQEQCDVVVYEAPMPLGMFNSHPAKGKNKGFFQSSAAETGESGFVLSEANVAFARGAIGVLECACSRASKPVEPVKVQDARDSVLGWRINVEKRSGMATKDRVVRDATLLMKAHGVHPENHNECDAWVIWRAACSRVDPKLAALTTPLFVGLQHG